MDVARIPHSDHGSHIEPPLNDDWDDLTKLEWKAAVVSVDAGLKVSVTEARVSHKARLGRWRRVYGLYDIRIPGHVGGAYDFYGAWTYLNGIEAGANAMRARVP